MLNTTIEPFANVDVDKLSKNLIKYIRKELDSEAVDYLYQPVRLTGGYETLIFRFQLSNVDRNRSRPLVIRLFSSSVGAEAVVKESEVQNLLSRHHYPVPAVHLSCTDKQFLGGMFTIMDFCEGNTLFDSGLPYSKVFEILGALHARMHTIGIDPIEKRCAEIGADIETLKYESALEKYRNHFRSNLPWLNEAADWLLDNRPEEPEALRICHGDFHPMNILYKAGKVQAVLDWSGFMIGDPAMDVAMASFLLNIPMGLLYPGIETDLAKEIYVKSYRRTAPLDEESMLYYRVFRSIVALSEGSAGHPLFRQPQAIELLQLSIFEMARLRIDVPTDS